MDEKINKPIMPPFKNWALQNFPFIEDDFDAITNYQLYCKIVEYMKSVDVYMQGVNTFLTEVENYFNNLDVQEEIDNKLDEMASDGTLEEIMASYLDTRAIFCFNTVADLKLATNLIDGSYVRTLGFHSIGDGGGSLYKINDDDTADEKSVIACQNDLVATIVLDKNEVYPEKFGAYGDETHDDAEAIQYAIDNYNVIRFYNKTYLISGIEISSNKTLIGENTTFKGTTTEVNGLQLYNNTNTRINYVDIENIKLIYFNVGLYAINVTHSIFKNVVCQGCVTGANFAGGCWVNKFYDCEFKDNTADGFKVGMDITHPLLGLTVKPNTATFDFHSCIFLNNTGYGISGWMRAFNFFGGYAQDNSLAGVRIENTDSRANMCNSFIGFDIEEEKIAYYFDGTEGTCKVSNLNIIGGQIAVEYDESTTCAILYFNGNTNNTNNYNIKVDARHSDNTNIYDVYVNSESAKSMQIEFITGNRNNANFTTNLSSFGVNGIVKNTNVTLPLSIFNNDYYDGTNLVIPAGKSVTLSIPEMKHLEEIIVTTTSSANFLIELYGLLTTEFRRIGSATGTSTDNVTTLRTNGPGSIFKLTNRKSSDITITDIKLTAFYKR